MATKVVIMKELKTREEILKIVKGKTIKDIKYEEGYANIDIIFDDGSYISVCALDCFDFLVEIPE